MTVSAWHELIGHLDPRDAFAALNLHRQNSDQWVQPKHIIDWAKAARRNREHDENAERAKHALPEPEGKPMPESIRELLNTLGKGPYASPAAQKTHSGGDSHGDAAGASEVPSRAAQTAPRAQATGTETK